jgi:FkbM family methyltransferase
MASRPQNQFLLDALKRISRTLRDMGVGPEHPAVDRIESEFRLLFCGGGSEAQMPSQPSGGKPGPIKPIADLTREGAPEEGRDTGGLVLNTATRSRRDPQGKGVEPHRHSSGHHLGIAALRRLVMRCAEPILARLRDYFVAPFIDRMEQSVENLAERLIPRMHRIERALENVAERVSRLDSQSGSMQPLAEPLASRIILPLGDELLIPTPGGYVLAPTDEQAGACVLAEGKGSGQGTTRLFDLTLKAAMTFIDVGAHLGVHTLYCARKVSPGGTVIAFEPAPKLFNLLKRSIHLNGLNEVCTCVNIRVACCEDGAKPRGAPVDPDEAGDRRRSNEEKLAPQVKADSLDRLLRGVQRVDVVKVDVKGTELDVLEGMKQTLTRHPGIVLVVEYGVHYLRRAGISPSEWFLRFFADGFAVFAIDERAGTWRQVPTEETTRLPSTKLVFVRPESRQWVVLKTHET